MAKKKAEVAKTPKQLAKERALQELTKVSMVQAKLSKIKSRPSRVTATEEEKESSKGGRQFKQKKRSRFERDLTDVSKKGVKKLR